LPLSEKQGVGSSILPLTTRFMKRYPTLSVFFKYNFYIGLNNTILIFIISSDSFAEILNITSVGQKRLAIFLTINLLFFVCILLRIKRREFTLQLLLSYVIIEVLFLNENWYSSINFLNWFEKIFLGSVIQYFLSPVVLYYFISSKTAFSKDSFENIKSKVKTNKNKFYLLISIIYLPVFLKIFSNDYLVGYWLTNYNHGFIRRGLVGTFFINLPISKGAVLLFVNLFVSFIYISIIYLTIKLFINSNNPYFIMFAASQFYLFYPLWDKGVIGRPEILGILTFLFSVNCINKKESLINSYLILILFNISIFTHEVNLFFLIPLVIVLLQKKHLVLISLLISSSLMFLIFYLNFSEISSQTYQGICDDIENLNIRDDICDGATKFLQYDESIDGFFMKNLTLNIFQANHYSYFSYIIPLFCSLFPFFYLVKGRDKRYNLLLILVSFFPLFYLSKDWGRWISLIFIIFSILLVNSEKEEYFVNKYLMLLLIMNITFYMNPSCCDVNVLVISNVPNNIFSNNFSIYFILFAVIFLKQSSKKS
tara:strand:- start:265 stop:1881 length:1617 start_codon:yes stop_codon:yes gene_type:complete